MWQPVEMGLVILLLSFDIVWFLSLFPFSKFMTYMIYLFFGSRNDKICFYLLLCQINNSDIMSISEWKKKMLGSQFCSVWLLSSNLHSLYELLIWGIDSNRKCCRSSLVVFFIGIDASFYKRSDNFHSIRKKSK